MLRDVHNLFLNRVQKRRRRATSRRERTPAHLERVKENKNKSTRKRLTRTAAVAIRRTGNFFYAEMQKQARGKISLPELGTETS